MTANCFICQIERGEFDRSAAGFAKHIRSDHNLCARRRSAPLLLAIFLILARLSCKKIESIPPTPYAQVGVRLPHDLPARARAHGVDGHGVVPD